MNTFLRPALALLLSTGLAGPALGQCVFTTKTTGGLFNAAGTYESPGAGCPTVPRSTDKIIIRGPVILNQNFTFSGNTGKLVIQSGGSLMEDGTPRTLTFGTGSGSALADRAVVESGGTLTVSTLFITKSTFTNNGPVTTTQTTVKCDLFVQNQGTLEVNGRVVVLGNLHLEQGNASLSGCGGLVVRGCVVGTNGALNNSTQPCLLVCVQKAPTTCGTGTCNTDIPLNNDANCRAILPPTLPVELTLFKASSSGTSVKLLWQTASERNAKEFVVERSATGREFGAIGRIAAAGNSSSLRNYTWQDNRPLAGQSYYRLRQVDLDGTTAFSSIVNVSAKTSSVALIIWPTNTPSVYEIGPLGADAIITTLTTQGRVVRTQALGATGGELNMRGFPAGIYIVRATTTLGTTTSRIVYGGE